MWSLKINWSQQCHCTLFSIVVGIFRSSPQQSGGSRFSGWLGSWCWIRSWQSPIWCGASERIWLAWRMTWSLSWLSWWTFIGHSVGPLCIRRKTVWQSGWDLVLIWLMFWRPGFLSGSQLSVIRPWQLWLFCLWSSWLTFFLILWLVLWCPCLWFRGSSCSGNVFCEVHVWSW